RPLKRNLVPRRLCRSSTCRAIHTSSTLGTLKGAHPQKDQEHAEEARMAQVTFGLFDWIDRGEAPLYQLYEERLQLRLADACARADGRAAGSERLQLRHLCVRLGHLPPRADTALAAPVCGGGDAGLCWQRHAAGLGPRQLPWSGGWCTILTCV